MFDFIPALILFFITYKDSSSGYWDAFMGDQAQYAEYLFILSAGYSTSYTRTGMPGTYNGSAASTSDIYGKKDSLGKTFYWYSNSKSQSYGAENQLNDSYYRYYYLAL